MKNNKTIWKNSPPPLHKQGGVIAVVVAIGIAALIGVVGLALDSGHLLLNKTRLQNAVDAAALSGARALQTSTSSTPLLDAETAAKATFTANLSTELNGDAPIPTVTFSEDLTPGSFMAATANPPSFIKVSSPVISLTSFLIKVLGIDNKQVNAVAVAGYGNGVDVCDVFPVMVCGDTTEPTQTATNFYGYTVFDPESPYPPETITLKMGTNDGWDPSVGSGNYHLINIPGAGNGDDVVRHALAGKSFCATTENPEPFLIDVQPGQGVGPVAQGVNTRFGIYQGAGMNSTTYPPDFANDDYYDGCGTGPTACLSPNEYLDAYETNDFDPDSKQYQRRMVTMPIANCAAGSATGNNMPDEMRIPLDWGCFLLTAPVQQGGSGANNGAIQGVFMHGDQCSPPTVGVGQSNGPTIIVLYKNPDGDDS